MTSGERLIAGLVAVMGLYAVVRNRSFAEASVVSSRRDFGIHLREGSRAYRFNWIFSRTMAITVGVVMLVGGTLGAIGIDWRDIYR
ncbi:hypothetical protein [Actinoplanes aureus]|uniref:Uncharacterized protein n=1 Tax=Actinoplanes aureus TaxID=2792083 RepID=A0A931CKB4_9ACTN|nr:hypothetical protein [Actinoplanes aureus]MBG0569257.1 hypothetical protein [Actinoplanes aureus]